VADGKVTPRVQALIKILLKYQHTEDFRAIIFVERVVTALVLPKVGSRDYVFHILRSITSELFMNSLTCFPFMIALGLRRTSIVGLYTVCKFDRS